MPSIKSRIAALAAQMKNMFPDRTTLSDLIAMYDQMDPLSQGMVDVVKELTGKDKAALLEEMNKDGYGMSMEDLENMIRSITVDY